MAAVLVLKLVAAFHEHTLLLAYGQQANDHLRLQIQDEVSGIIEHVREKDETPSLDKLFKAFKAKCVDLTGKAAAALKESKHDKVLSTPRLTTKSSSKGSQACWQPQQGPGLAQPLIQGTPASFGQAGPTLVPVVLTVDGKIHTPLTKQG
ncbi:hypothetical protein WJX77_000492 [Trebouxia sp. C0004]